MGVILQSGNVDISVLEVGNFLLSEQFHYTGMKLYLEREAFWKVCGSPGVIFNLPMQSVSGRTEIWGQEWMGQEIV